MPQGHPWLSTKIQRRILNQHLDHVEGEWPSSIRRADAVFSRRTGDFRGRCRYNELEVFVLGSERSFDANAAYINRAGYRIDSHVPKD